jgi:predicted acylesterase/phospholipase RssA
MKIFIPPRRLCLSGGGIRVVSYIGALEVLQEKNILQKVKEICGVSAGGMIGFSLSLGYTLKEITQVCTQFDFSQIRHLDLDEMVEFTEKYGFDTGDKLRAFLRSLLKQKGYKPECTFEDLKNLKPQLRVYATDINTCEIKEYSLSKTPQTQIVEALFATMALPIYFMPSIDQETGHYMLDGGIINNNAYMFLTEEEKKESLSFVFSWSHTNRDVVEDFFTFLNQIHGCLYVPKFSFTEEDLTRTIILPEGDFPSWNFEATMDEKMYLIKRAKDTTKYFFKEKLKNKITRRYSVS